MSLQVSATFNPGTHIILPKEHLWSFAGVVDEAGRELTHAHVIAAVRNILGEPLMKLLAHRDRHLDNPDHPIHQDALEAANARIKGTWRIERFNAEVEFYAAKLLGVARSKIKDFESLPAEVKATALELMARDIKPEISEFEEAFLNLFTTNGVNCLFTVANAGTGAANSGASAAAATAAFNTTQSRIGVGDSSTAATAADTNLNAATNKLWTVVSGAPTISTNTMAFTTSVTSGNGNFAWQEFAVDNCGGSNATSTTRSGGTMLDHVVSNQGTKATGQTWNPTLTLSIS